MINLFTRRRGRKPHYWSAVALVSAVAVSGLLFALTGSAGAVKRHVAAADDFLTATYMPIKLRAAGDPAEVRFDISCLPPGGDAEGPGVCDGGGTVYFRAGTTVASVPLQLDPDAQVGRYVAAVPPAIWNAQLFTYYAVLRDNSTGRTIVLPHGGSSAPQISLAMNGPSVDLGTHAFGATRAATARIAEASWGVGDGQVGLEDGIDMPAGGSSFDVDSSGAVYLMDEANSRLLKFGGGSVQAIPLPGLAGVRADLRVSDSTGTAYVLETASASSSSPVLRSFTLQGVPLGSSAVADAAAAQVRLSGSTAYVSEYPSSVWAPVLQNNGRAPVDASAQGANALSGAPTTDGNVFVLSTGNEIRVGTTSTGGSRFSTVRITSATPVADIQLAQKLPNGRLLVVFSVYTDTDHEYQALVLDPSGAVADQFSLPAAEWAQSMPLSRFRVVGSSLYELGSTDTGVFVDRYDLGVS
ncbi:MAG TPA: hypothetical protein VLJ76_11735 [Gaiellaceae bacterium]|nr:hypothetical protein [Gaiellaceae bacterium]